MGGWLRQILLSAQVHAGLSAGIALWALTALAASLIAVIFFLIAAYVWLSKVSDHAVAGLIIGGAFLALAIVALVAALMARRRNIERARFELQVRKATSPGLLDPKLMAMGYQIGQAIGWRKVASLGAVGLLAALAAREWVGRRHTSADEDAGDETES
jgi:uncharacterized membrane protein YedE/YeeE